MEWVRKLYVPFFLYHCIIQLLGLQYSQIFPLGPFISFEYDLLSLSPLTFAYLSPPSPLSCELHTFGNKGDKFAQPFCNSNHMS